MGLSETIVAAMIGAAATIGTALFQLLTAFKAARGKPDVKPRRGTTARSVLAVAVLMVASAGGGFLYSQLLREREGEDIRAMRQELRELRDLTAATVMERNRLAPSAVATPDPVPDEPPVLIPASLEPTAGVAESIAYVPACRIGSGDSAAQCQESDAQRIALCGTVPTSARVNAVELFAQPDAVQHPWDQHGATLDTDLGGARFTGRTFEYSQSAEVKAVCMNFLHWSSQHPHIARIVVHYQNGETLIEPNEITTPDIQSQPVLSQTTPGPEGIQASSQPTSFAAPAAAVVP